MLDSAGELPSSTFPYRRMHHHWYVMTPLRLVEDEAAAVQTLNRIRSKALIAFSTQFLVQIQGNNISRNRVWRRLGYSAAPPDAATAGNAKPPARKMSQSLGLMLLVAGTGRYGRYGRPQPLTNGVCTGDASPFISPAGCG